MNIVCLDIQMLIGVHTHIQYTDLLPSPMPSLSTPILVQSTYVEREGATSSGRRPSPALKDMMQSVFEELNAISSVPSSEVLC